MGGVMHTGPGSCRLQVIHPLRVSLWAFCGQQARRQLVGNRIALACRGCHALRRKRCDKHRMPALGSYLAAWVFGCVVLVSVFVSVSLVMLSLCLRLCLCVLAAEWWLSRAAASCTLWLMAPAPRTQFGLGRGLVHPVGWRSGSSTSSLMHFVRCCRLRLCLAVRFPLARPSCPASRRRHCLFLCGAVAGMLRRVLLLATALRVSTTACSALHSFLVAAPTSGVGEHPGAQIGPRLTDISAHMAHFLFILGRPGQGASLDSRCSLPVFCKFVRKGVPSNS